MSSLSFTVNDASLAPFTSTSLHSLFCGVLSTGDAVAYTGLALLDTGAPPLFNGVPFGSKRSALNWWSSAGCATGGAGEEAAEVAAGGGEFVAGDTELGAGWCPSGAAGSRAGGAGVAIVVMTKNWRISKLQSQLFKKVTWPNTRIHFGECELRMERAEEERGGWKKSRRGPCVEKRITYLNQNERRIVSELEMLLSH